MGLGNDEVGDDDAVASKADRAKSWIKKRSIDDGNVDDDKNSTTIIPSQVSKEVEEALSFAKRTKEKNQQQQQQKYNSNNNNNNNNNNNKTSGSSNNSIKQQPKNSIQQQQQQQQQQQAKKVVFAPAPSRPVWNARPATASSLTAAAQPFNLSLIHI